jgi:hypothetical protein
VKEVVEEEEDEEEGEDEEEEDEEEGEDEVIRNYQGIMDRWSSVMREHTPIAQLACQMFFKCAKERSRCSSSVQRKPSR